MPRDRRILLLLAAVAIAAVVAAVVIAFAVTGGSPKHETATTDTAAAALETSLGGIPQNGATLGRANAPATVIEFADLQCPYCAQWANDTLPSVVDAYVRTGRINLVFRGLHFIGPDSLTALGAVVAAGFQDKLWNFVETTYARQGPENSGWVTTDLIREIAASIPGLDVQRLMRDRTSKKALAAIRENDLLGIRLGVNATPTFFVERPPATPKKLELTALDYGTFKTALDAVLIG